MKKHHPKNKFERLQLEAIKREQRERESAYVRRRTADLQQKEAEDDIREEVR